MSGTGGGVAAQGFGFVALPGVFDFSSSASGDYVNTSLGFTLPGAGTYQLNAVVRSTLSSITANDNAWILARFFNVTAGAPVVDSEAIVHQLVNLNGGSATNLGWQRTSPIDMHLTVTGTTTLRLEVARVIGAGTIESAALLSDVNGRTTISYRRIG